MITLDKAYDPTQVESKWSVYWIEHDLFHARADSPRPKYTIVIPPPNVTGMLTMGHILNNTIQDLLIRWKRMEGYETLWLPGTDHAGIATQNKVEAALKKEGLSRHDIGREKLLERIWEWKNQYGGIILKQLRRLGASCDWKRERFTMDEGLSRAVTEVFVRLYKKKLIYRGRRLINWCPRCHTALSDEEASSKDIQSKFWHITYPLESEEGEVVVSTTRPETMLGDTAVAVHPDDKRYRSLIGKSVILPLMDRRIPVVADEHANPEKGSGAVKITPAHDFDDFEVGQRHKLDQISVIDKTGRMNKNAGMYKGMDRFEARMKILEDLKAKGLLREEEPRTIPIPHCYRCDTVVEPHLSDQWFVRMKPLAEPAVEAVRSGRIRFHPRHWEDTYFHWMDNIRDWCISRQIWWGHRIPVYTCRNGHVFVNREKPEVCPTCGDDLPTQDPDVLDTWFSSWLWPFSTLGWPEKTRDLKAFFPTDTLVTGPDIIFFWVARMIMASLEFMKEIPFTDVYFNGMIRDLSGRKMSKSLGNSPDPLWLIEGADAKTIREFSADNPSYRDGIHAYGADAVRLTMVYLTPLGGDIHFDHTLVEFGRKFCNKLWNAARFVLMNTDETAPGGTVQPGTLTGLPERWILSRLQRTIADVRRYLEMFHFNDATRTLYAFVWGEYCDWYLELAKPCLYNRNDPESQQMTRRTAREVLETLLRLLHPFIPFITEEIWQSLPHDRNKSNAVKSILLQPYPKPEPEWLDETAETEMDRVQAVIGAIRNIRGEMNVPQDTKAPVMIRGGRDQTALIEASAVYLETLAQVSMLTVGEKLEKPAHSATALAQNLEIFLPLEGIIDIRRERERIEKELQRMEGFLKNLETKLQNPEFNKKAPEDVVSREKKKHDDFQEKINKLRHTLSLLDEAS
ncbi:MAG TPA: valine--tRNA ligase [bacterium]|nr:valine--tRNA ligase [bacterium]